MLFCSTAFIFFFLPAFLVADRLCPASKRNVLLIFASALFYFWGETLGLCLLSFLSVLNWGIAFCILRSKRHAKKIWLSLGIAIDILILFYFKYFVWLARDVLQLPEMGNLGIVLPLGISFFTFHAISYIVDVYRGIVKAHDGVDFIAYFFMFPHLVAGPIVRFENVRPYLQERRRNPNLFRYGLLRFVIGLNKKMLIANPVASLADVAFMANPAILSTGDAWIGAIAYAIQIYFDFSGYSDMAIGLAAMMGIEFDENFHHPYQANSIRDFWRRWHITLSAWLRDYVYIPLGGSKCTSLLTYRNLLLVFILCGLWHGANYTFLVWGLFHGSLLVAERTPFGKILSKLPLTISRGYTFFMVLLGWVVFRSDSMDFALTYLSKMFVWDTLSPMQMPWAPINLLALVTGIGIALFYRHDITLDKVKNNIISIPYLIVMASCFVMSLLLLYADSRNPFIYFNF